MLVFVVFFFFKQKTAYEMRISDWSSDVCSSDLRLCGYVWPQVGYQPLLPPPVFAEQPSMTVAFVFPGQGSQAVGMGRALAEAFAVARHTLEEVDDAHGQKLSRLMFEGPEEELRLTANAQPALMAASLAAVRVLESEGARKSTRRAAFRSEGHTSE